MSGRSHYSPTTGGMMRCVAQPGNCKLSEEVASQLRELGIEGYDSETLHDLDAADVESLTRRMFEAETGNRGAVGQGLSKTVEPSSKTIAHEDLALARSMYSSGDMDPAEKRAWEKEAFQLGVIPGEQSPNETKNDSVFLDNLAAGNVRSADGMAWSANDIQESQSRYSGGSMDAGDRREWESEAAALGVNAGEGLGLVNHDAKFNYKAVESSAPKAAPPTAAISGEELTYNRSIYRHMGEADKQAWEARAYKLGVNANEHTSIATAHDIAFMGDLAAGKVRSSDGTVWSSEDIQEAQSRYSNGGMDQDEKREWAATSFELGILRREGEGFLNHNAPYTYRTVSNAASRSSSSNQSSRGGKLKGLLSGLGKGKLNLRRRYDKRSTATSSLMGNLERNSASLGSLSARRG